MKCKIQKNTSTITNITSWLTPLKLTNTAPVLLVSIIASLLYLIILYATNRNNNKMKLPDKDQ